MHFLMILALPRAIAVETVVDVPPSAVYEMWTRRTAVSPGAKWDEAHAFFSRAWRAVLDQLKKSTDRRTAGR